MQPRNWPDMLRRGPKLTWRSRARERLGLVTTRQLVRSLWLGAAIGLVAGVGAIVFAEAIRFATEHLLGTLAGYEPAQPLGEGAAESSGPTRRWALPVVLGIGGLISGLLVFLLAPEAEGHGTDAAIGAYHRRGGRSRFRVVPVKLVASAITIGSGGAAGREGPSAQIGGGFGSWVADRLHLEPSERRRALAAGMGAGIGAIFRAPLGGALMAAEVLYKHDFEAEVILLALISSIVGYSIYGTYDGWTPIFGTQSFSFSHASELPYYLMLGLLCGGAGLVYARVFYGAVTLFGRLATPRILKPAIGGVLVGIVGMLAPEAIHVGYGTVQQLLTRDGVMGFSPWLLLALPLLRILTTSLTVGSGGSGGIFGPGMVVGGVLGAGIWRIGHGLPGFPSEPGPVVIICMIATFGSIAHVPLAMLLMVGEMTGNLSLLAPAMVAVAVATLVVGDTSIYESQVATRVDSPAHRHRFAFPLLSALAVRRAMRRVPILSAESAVHEIIPLLTESRIVLVERHGQLEGYVDVEKFRTDAPAATSTLDALAEDAGPQLDSELSLDDALDRIVDSGRSWLPVVESNGQPLGIVDARSLVRAYREAARAPGVRSSPFPDTVEALVSDLSSACDRTLAELAFPAGTRVVSLIRDDRVVVPNGETVLRAGDHVFVGIENAALRPAVVSILEP